MERQLQKPRKIPGIDQSFSIGTTKPGHVQERSGISKHSAGNKDAVLIFRLFRKTGSGKIAPREDKLSRRTMNETKIKNYNFPPRGQKPLYFAGKQWNVFTMFSVKQIAVFLFCEDIVFASFDCKMLIKDFV